jgi:hypothetical protein
MFSTVRDRATADLRDTYAPLSRDEIPPSSLAQVNFAPSPRELMNALCVTQH